MAKLIIVESPTKAKTITKFLGKGYKVESSFGHIRDLPKSKMGVDIEGLTFEPSYVIPRDKSAQVKKLKEIAKKSDGVIFATDEDREGEAISWHLANVLGIKPEKAERMVFHEITEHAIKEALEHPRALNLRLVDAQQARRVLDRLVGYELSPFLWRKVAKGLSAGRVQSVSVRLVVEREREIQNFKPVEYWSLEGTFEKIGSKEEIKAKLQAIKDKKLDKLGLKNKDEVDGIVKALQGVKYEVSNLEEKTVKRNPSPPFTTSSLQQEANNHLGYSAKQTMRLAQQLYEGVELGSEGSIGLITYMRTDSVNLSDKFLHEAKTEIAKSFGDKYTLPSVRAYKSKSKNAQEAHEAIRPTSADRSPELIKPFVEPKLYKLYDLIWRRALSTQMAAAEL
ncbi:MAG TPA: type I DNA topoisomerase, partial [Patescibacteria group bacterium]|nr:type I DNA topoisomerase [Patescibacteria group bacterium]